MKVFKPTSPQGKLFWPILVVLTVLYCSIRGNTLWLLSNCDRLRSFWRQCSVILIFSQKYIKIDSLLLLVYTFLMHFLFFLVDILFNIRVLSMQVFVWLSERFTSCINLPCNALKFSLYSEGYKRLTKNKYMRNTTAYGRLTIPRETKRGFRETPFRANRAWSSWFKSLWWS
jgi:hypothetical protein